VREAIGYELSAEFVGCGVKTASTGEEAVEAVQQN